jgi:hypothetical protein
MASVRPKFFTAPRQHGAQRESATRASAKTQGRAQKHKGERKKMAGAIMG